jgi:effector-associated domain 9 (EAD9)-containing protein
MRDCMTSSFWAEGPKRLRKALEDRRAELEQLAAQLRAAKDAEERERLERQIIRLLEEYAPSEQEIGQSLFLLR